MLKAQVIGKGRSVVINSAAQIDSPSRTPSVSPQSTRGIRLAQGFILLAVYVVPALWCFRVPGFADADVWWHMRSAEWILQHHAVPHTDPFSSFGAGKAWAAYSWLFEVMILGLFQKLGLTGIVAYSIGMVVLFTVALHRVIRHLQADFTIGILLTFAACYCLTPLDMPRSWWFTILFFVLELDILMQVRRTGKHNHLAWLPLLFVLWANLHIQFVYGLVMIVLALGEAALSMRFARFQTRARTAPLLAVTVACVLAVLANPYGWGIYRVVFQYATDSQITNGIYELQAMSFRSAEEFGVLFFAIAGAAVLARVGRIDLFETGLLAFALISSFRMQRDMWIVVVVASAVIAAEWKSGRENRLLLKAPGISLAAAGAALVALLVFHSLPVDNAQMQESLAKRMPVRAVEVVKERGYCGPLYNDFAWGGYLIWSLRMPVLIDGRTNLPGADGHIHQVDATWAGSPGWAADPDLVKAGLVIGPVDSPLVQLLRMDQRFKLAYEDNIAAVFIAGSNASAAINQGATFARSAASANCSAPDSSDGGNSTSSRR